MFVILDTLIVHLDYLFYAVRCVRYQWVDVRSVDKLDRVEPVDVDNAGVVWSADKVRRASRCCLPVGCSCTTNRLAAYLHVVGDVA